MADVYKPPESDSVLSNAEKLKPSRRVRPWIIICLATGAVSILYRVLLLGHKEQTSLMFIGIPLLMAIGIALTPQAKSTTGMIIKGMSLALLLSGVLLIEGFICIIMATPLFFLVGAIVGWAVDRAKAKDEERWNRNKMQCSVVGVLALMSFEGVSDFLSFSRDETVEVVREVDLSRDEVLRLLSEGPEFDEERLPAFLTLGFPQPQGVKGGGVEVGDVWTIPFTGGEGEPGELVFRVAESSLDEVKFVCERDGSHIAHWMQWRSITWKIEELSESTCQVTVVMKYERLLDPAWYFKPIERYGVKRSGEYFLQQVVDGDQDEDEVSDD